MINKNSIKKSNKKQLMFMKILITQIIQFAESSEEDALDFVLDIIEKMDKAKVRIK